MVYSISSLLFAPSASINFSDQRTEGNLLTVTWVATSSVIIGPFSVTISEISEMEADGIHPTLKCLYRQLLYHQIAHNDTMTLTACVGLIEVIKLRVSYVQMTSSIMI